MLKLPVNPQVPTFLDNVQLWDWYATFITPTFGQHVAITMGRQMNSIAQGLLVDNEAQPLVGATLDTGFGPVTFGINGSVLDRFSTPTQYPVAPVSPANNLDGGYPQDTYGYTYLGYGCRYFNIVGTYLISGAYDEQGYSVGLDARLCHMRFFGEYAELTKNAAGLTPLDNKDYAWVGGVDLLNNWNGLSLTVKYGEVMPGYTTTYSILNPYSSINNYDIDWVDRPLFLEREQRLRPGQRHPGVRTRSEICVLWLLVIQFTVLWRRK